MNWKRIAGVSLMLMALVIVGCSKKEAERAEDPEDTADGETAAAAGPAQPVDLATGATVTGKVEYTGAKVVPIKIQMDAEPSCARIHGGPVPSQEVTVNDNGTLRYVLVYVKDGLGNKTYKPIDPVEKMDQHGCLYEPHVLGIVAGQELDISNSDDTTHNIHPMPKVNREWNESQAKGDLKKKSFTQTEMPPIPVKCNIHPWMRSYIAVFNHPFFSVTSKDGTFTIKGLPPGTYTIGAWQEKFGETTQKITVKAKDSATMDFKFNGA